MGSKVLRWAGAVLLAGFFLAASAARGQTVAPDQNSAQIFGSDEIVAAALAGEIYRYSEIAGVSPGRDFGASPQLDGELPDAPVASRGDLVSFSQTNRELPDAPVARAGVAAGPPDDESAPYTPITGRGRLVWVVKNTLWPEHLAAGVITMGIATARDAPPEDGPHWGGFGERFGVRLTGVATSGTMEAGLGAIWGEDPRYFRVPEESFGARVENVIKMTFLARRSDGRIAPAYARYIAISGSNFLSNTWRADSDADTSDAVRRTFEGFAGHMVGNAWNEFWPDAKRYIFHRGRSQP